MKIHMKYFNMKYEILYEILYNIKDFLINNLSFIVSFQGEPGVRGPPGLPGPRGIGAQGPKVSPQVCALGEGQVPPMTMHRKCSL